MKYKEKCIVGYGGCSIHPRLYGLLNLIYILCFYRPECFFLSSREMLKTLLLHCVLCLVLVWEKDGL